MVASRLGPFFLSTTTVESALPLPPCPMMTWRRVSAADVDAFCAAAWAAAAGLPRGPAVLSRSASGSIVPLASVDARCSLGRRLTGLSASRRRVVPFLVVVVAAFVATRRPLSRSYPCTGQWVSFGATRFLVVGSHCWMFLFVLDFLAACSSYDSLHARYRLVMVVRNFARSLHPHLFPVVSAAGIRWIRPFPTPLLVVAA